MLRKILFLTICFTFVLGIFTPNAIFASDTDGTIDSTFKYAWGENIGWINFGLYPNGNVHVTDSALSGYAWSEKYGWINLNANGTPTGHVTNNGEGTLGGNAWGEKLGWINFTGVVINPSGNFSGYATISRDSSKISFNCANTSSCGSSNFKLNTDWRPVSTRQTLTLSLSDNIIGFGTLSVAGSRFATPSGGSDTEAEAHTVSISTSASSGYALTVEGDTLTNTNNGAQNISSIGIANTASVPGTEQFGLRMEHSGGSGIVTAPYSDAGFAYDATSSTPSQVASSVSPSIDIYSVRYISNISGTTEAGSYIANLTYIVTANF